MTYFDFLISHMFVCQKEQIKQIWEFSCKSVCYLDLTSFYTLPQEVPVFKRNHLKELDIYHIVAKINNA